MLVYQRVLLYHSPSFASAHGRCEVGTDRHGSSRFAHQGDALWITAEAVDIPWANGTARYGTVRRIKIYKIYMMNMTMMIDEYDYDD